MLASKLLFLLSSVIAMGTVRGDDRSLGYDAFCSKDSAIIKRPHACFTSKDGPIVPDARIEEPSDHWNFPSTVNTAWAVVLDPNTSAAFRTKNHFIRLYTDTEDANDGCLKYDIAAWPVTSAIPQLTIVRHCPQDGPIVIPK